MTAKSLAVKYLERRLPRIIDPYQVAIVTHALLEAGSIEAEVGFNKLDHMKREKGKYLLYGDTLSNKSAFIKNLLILENYDKMFSIV